MKCLLNLWVCVFVISLACGGGGGAGSIESTKELSGTEIQNRLKTVEGTVDFGTLLSKPKYKKEDEFVEIENIQTKEIQIVSLNENRFFSATIAEGNYKMTAVSADQRVVKKILLKDETSIQDIEINEQTTSVAVYVESVNENGIEQLSETQLVEHVQAATISMELADHILTDEASTDAQRTSALTMLSIHKRVETLNQQGEGDKLVKKHQIEEFVLSQSVLEETVTAVSAGVVERTQSTVYLSSSHSYSSVEEIHKDSQSIKQVVTISTKEVIIIKEVMTKNTYIKEEEPIENEETVSDEVNLTDGILAHYHFDDGYGDTLTDTAGEHHGRTFKTQWVGGFSGKSLRFNGKGAYVYIPEVQKESLESFCISMMVRAKGYHYHDARLISKADGTLNKDHSWMLSTILSDDNKIRLRVRLKTGDTVHVLEADQGNIKKYTWTHVVLNYDGNSLCIYQDNVKVGSMDVSGSIPLETQKAIFIGANPNYDKYFYGDIDQVRIYNRALNKAEINKLSEKDVVASKLYAGDDKWIDKGDLLKLNGKISQEADHDSILWSLMEGPDKVLFSNKNDLNSHVEFLKDGLYRLQLKVEHNELITVDDIFVRVGSLIHESLLAHYKMDDTDNGHVLDWSLNNFHGDIQGAKDVRGKFDRALFFDGANDHVDLGVLDVPESTEQMSIAAWIKVNAFETSDARIISKASGHENDQHTWMLSTIEINNKHYLRTRLKTQSSEKTTVLTAEIGEIKRKQWMHVAMVYSGTYLMLYVNGDKVAEKTLSGDVEIDPNKLAWIGANPSDEKFFNGTIDDLRIYTRALDKFDFIEFVKHKKH